jgi:phenylacetic acid degradation operon negative regulatory protein
MVETPRSLVLNLFGDYLRYAGGEAKLGELTELMTAFGLEPGTVRVSMSRLRQEGWFTTRRDGRETVYALSDQMLDILVNGRPRIFRRKEEPWSGRWTMVIYQVPDSDRAVREQLRKQLAWTGFGQLLRRHWWLQGRVSPLKSAVYGVPDIGPFDGPHAPGPCLVIH